MKISFTNAKEVISEMLNGFELKRAKDDSYYEMTESEFDKIVSKIFENSTKTFKEALAKQTKKYNIVWLNKAKGARISTYKYDYAFIKFTA